MLKDKLIAGVLVGLFIGAILGHYTALSQIGSLETQVSTLQSQVADLQTQLAGKATLLQNVMNERDRLHGENSRLKANITVLETQVQQLQVDIEKIRARPVVGMCYGPFRDGQNPGLGPFPTVEQIKDDMRILKSITNCIRIYSSTNVLASIPSLANQSGLRVYQGVFLAKDPKLDGGEIDSAVSLAKQGLAESVIVGNEGILLGILTESELIQYIHRVRQDMPKDIPITTAEGWNIWMDHPNLVKETDYIMIHVHPFWENQPIDEAATYVVEKYQQLKEKYPNKRIVIGETGWPSAGDPTWAGVSALVVPSEANQRKFLEEFIRLASKNSIEYFLFEAFDEEWKWKESRSSGNVGELTEPRDRTFSGRVVGSSWGIFQSNGKLKPQLSELFKEVPTDSTRQIRDIYVGERFSAGYDMGVDTSGRRTGWVSNMNGSMRMAYPARQEWGAAFVTVGKPADPPRPWKDFSEFQTISIELKGEHGGESVEIGLKDAYDPDDGSEVKTRISNLGTDWQTYKFSLSSFHTANLKQLYVVAEFVFSGSTARTVYFRNIKYLS